jgi:iron complex outermembrane receptor protein
MLSHHLRPDQNVRATFSYGSFNTRLYEASYDSGRLGPGGKSSFMLDLHQMKSDGYQTFNFQRRNAFSGKYQYIAAPKTILTLFTSVVELKSNTPDTKNPTRAQVAQFGDNYLLSDDPTKGNYYGTTFTIFPRTLITSA